MEQRHVGVGRGDMEKQQYVVEVSVVAAEVVGVLVVAAEVVALVVEVVGVLVVVAEVVVVETRGRRQGRYGAIVLRGLCHPRHHLCHQIYIEYIV